MPSCFSHFYFRTATFFTYVKSRVVYLIKLVKFAISIFYEPEIIVDTKKRSFESHTILILLVPRVRYLVIGRN